MCAIVDANVANEVFGPDRPPAGQHFFEWLDSPRGSLVIGGRLREELSQDSRFLRWIKTAIAYGRARSIDDDEVDERAAELRQLAVCSSDDEHVLALALVSGARLLYTNDRQLIRDFKDQEIVSDPRGKIYTTDRSGEITATHKRLVARHLCRPS